MEKDGLGLWSPAISPEKRRKDGGTVHFRHKLLAIHFIARR
jgi:hypothetical protein